jgi:beta-glucanase (GH16 family)
MTYLFEDEFNGPKGSKPDPTKWTAKTGAAVDGGTAYYDGFTHANLDGNGNLVIDLTKQSDGKWHSAYLLGRVLYSGPRRVEARVKVAAGSGAWSAPLWEWSSDGKMENDVCEQLGRYPNDVAVHLHNWRVSPQRVVGDGQRYSASSPLANAFHIYAAELRPASGSTTARVDYFLDGVLKRTLYPKDIGFGDDFVSTSYHFHPIVDLDVGGSWAGTPTFSTPRTMLIDYIRVTAL